MLVALGAFAASVALAAAETDAGRDRGPARGGDANARLASASAGDGRGGVELRKLGQFASPADIGFAPGHPQLAFVVERDGRVVALRRGRRAGTFLDISRRVTSGGERGLLSIAFAPDYERSRRFYVYFTNRKGDIEVDHFRRSTKRATRALRSSRKRIIRIRHRYAANHNGGTVAFGPDGHMYIGTGDGGGGGDPFENAQDRRSLLGKLLRIDPRPRSKRRYATPKGNPFVGRKGRREIFSLGLRNPFRFSFDRRKPHIAIGDVGQSAYEEVNYLRLREARGANFGWDAFEGRHAFDAAGDDEARVGERRHDAPMHEYSHGRGSCSVTGGLRVRDRSLGSLAGRYLYADFCKGDLRSFVPRLKRNRAARDRALGLAVDSPVAFRADRRERVHVVSLRGAVYRLAASK